jgi:hypothetical protein
MNKYILLIIKCLLVLGVITCKPKKVEPEPEVEQTLFENLKSCCEVVDCTQFPPDPTGVALNKLMKTDSVVLKDIKGKLNLVYIGIDDSFRTLINPIRFPEWGKGHLLYACNTPKELKNSDYYYDIEYDCVFYQFGPSIPGGRIETWPIRLTRVKVLSKIAK